MFACNLLPRDAGNGLFVVKMKTKLSVDYLKRKRTILYKYVVFSHQSEIDNPYEFLYGAPHGTGLTNRALKLPYSIHSSGGQSIYKCIFGGILIVCHSK